MQWDYTALTRPKVETMLASSLFYGSTACTCFPLNQVSRILASSSFSGAHSMSRTTKSAFMPASSLPVILSQKTLCAAPCVPAENALNKGSAKRLLTTSSDCGSLADLLVVAVYRFGNGRF